MRVYLSDHLRWFCCVYCPNILYHRTVIVRFLIKMVAEFAVYLTLLLGVQPRVLCQINGEGEHISLVKHLQPLLKRLFVIAVDLEYVSLTAPRRNSSLTDLAFLGDGIQVVPEIEDIAHRGNQCLGMTNQPKVWLEKDKGRCVEEGVRRSTPETAA